MLPRIYWASFLMAPYLRQHRRHRSFLPSRTTQLSVNKDRFLERSSRQEQRIYELEKLPTPSSNQLAELEGLKSKSFVEQYDPSSFSEAHADFKLQHNQVFRQLCLYKDIVGQNKNIFFLDGPDAGTATVLLKDSTISRDRCYVANRHGSTCDTLRTWGLPNVAQMDAQTALTTVFADVPFGAFYFDGCGGYAPILIDMMKAAISHTIQPPIVIGFSIVGGNRNVVDKELVILRELVRLVRPWKVEQVLVDCERYGMADIPKMEGNTVTSWVIVVEDS